MNKYKCSLPYSGFFSTSLTGTVQRKCPLLPSVVAVERLEEVEPLYHSLSITIARNHQVLRKLGEVRMMTITRIFIISFENLILQHPFSSPPILDLAVLEV